MDALGKLNDLRRLQSGENKQQLRCFRADPFDYQSLVDAMKGCCGLFYVFEPPHDQPYDVRADRIDSSLLLRVLILHS